MYVLVREDLSPAQRAVQAAHAAIEAAHHFLPEIADHPHLVLCAVRDLKALLKVSDYLVAAGVAFRTFVEPDIGDQPTTIATEPLRGEKRQPLTRFRLLGG